AKGMVELATESRLAVNDPEALLRIEGPGEYEVADFSIRGVAARRHIDGADADELLATNYKIDVADIRIALLGNVVPQLDEDQLESLGIVDIAIIPVGGTGYTIDATAAAGLIRQIEPKVVIPVHYAEDGLSYEVPQEGVDTFLTELGVPVEETSKYKIKSAASLPESLTVVKLQRS